MCKVEDVDAQELEVRMLERMYNKHRKKGEKHTNKKSVRKILGGKKL